VVGQLALPPGPRRILPKIAYRGQGVGDYFPVILRSRRKLTLGRWTAIRSLTLNRHKRDYFAAMHSIVQ
jgi:hypothetical protein